MKRGTALVLSALLLGLACCGAAPGRAADGGAGEPPAGAPPGDVYEVVMQYPFRETVPPDIRMVEDAINRRTEKEIGVHVTLYPVSSLELNSTTNLMVSSNEKLDLMVSLYEGGVGGYVNKGCLLPLDELVQRYGRDILAAEGPAMSGGVFNGRLYAVPSEEKMGRVKGFMARRDLLDKYDIPYDATHIYSYEELTEIFAAIKAGEGEDFYCIAQGNVDDPPFYFIEPIDFLGASLASGGLPDYGAASTEIVNFYESEAFETLCGYAREWYREGYFAPDVNTTTDSPMGLVGSGRYLGAFGFCEPDMLSSWQSTARELGASGMVPLYTTRPAAMTQFYQLSMWGIPVTCENPEKTMQWLNLMYADEEIINLLYRGVEGVHWQFKPGSARVIEPVPQGEGPARSYYSIYNVWGDKSKAYVTAPRDESYYPQLEAFNHSIQKENTSLALGYCFNSAPVKAEYAAVTQVIHQYQSSLALGVVEPANVLPEFIAALNQAGIRKIIAENQRQFDAWLAGNA